MSKAYLVTSGDYSDYRIVGVFSTREAAEACIDRQAEYGSDNNDIEEWDLDLPLEMQLGCYVCRVDADGEVVTEQRSTYYTACEPAKKIGRLFQGYGKTPEHAKRSAIDLWREWKAFAKADA
jgi:hypothetical protein